LRQTAPLYQRFFRSGDGLNLACAKFSLEFGLRQIQLGNWLPPISGYDFGLRQIQLGNWLSAPDKTGAPAGHTAKRFLPLALRLFIIRLPCFVDILFLKPCVRARLILLG
jgi:hypothetical protein